MASTDGNMTNITASKNSYGLYVNRTTYATLTGFHISNNTYGISIDNSTDFYLNSGVTLSNSGTDLYCSKSAYNSSLLSIDSTGRLQTIATPEGIRLHIPMTDRY